MHRRSKSRRPLYAGLAIAVAASGIAVAANASEPGDTKSAATAAADGNGTQNRVLAEDIPTDEELLSQCGRADVCTYTVKETSRFLGERHSVGSTVVNCEPESISRQITWSDTTESSSNVDLSFTAGASFEGVLNASFSATFGFGFENSHTKSESFTETLRPFSKSEVIRATAMVQTIGDWELHFGSRFHGHFFWFDKDVSVTTEDPNGSDLLIFRQKTLSEADVAEFCEGANITLPKQGEGSEVIIQDSDLPELQSGRPAKIEPGDGAEGAAEQ